MLHTLRQVVNDDKKWREILRGLNTEFYHQTVTTRQIEDFISTKTGMDITAFWNQYLRTVMIPKIEYASEGNTVRFRYVDIVENFEIPVIAIVNGTEKWITPKSEWQTTTFDSPVERFAIKADFYVNSEQVE